MLLIIILTYYLKVSGINYQIYTIDAHKQPIKILYYRRFFQVNWNHCFLLSKQLQF